MKKNNSGNLEEPDLMDNEELPEGWQEAPLLELCELIRGVSYTKGEESHTSGKGFVPLLRANNIDRELKFDDIYYVPERYVKPKQLLQQGDALFAMSSGSKSVVGKAATVKKPFDGTFGAFCGVLRPSSQVDWNFFGYFFQTRYYRDRISKASAGVNINNLKREYFEAINFPLPPLSEQKCIVSRVEAILAHVNTARDRLSRVPLIMKRFRQGVLAAACCGRLTEGWREEERNSDILKRDKETILKTFENFNLDDLNFKFRSPIDLPSGWTYSALKDLGKWYSGGTPSKSHDEYWSNGTIPWISPKDMKLDILNDSEDHITGAGLSSGRLHLLPKGTILFVVRGLILARNFPIAITNCEATINQDIKAIIPHSFVSEKYLLHALQNESGKILFAVKESTHGTKRLESESLQYWPIPLPPLTEQHEIVRCVDALFERADAIEREVAAAAKRTEALTQAVLGKAFRGELVPAGMAEGQV